jgi:hypothetical protein
MVTDWVEEGHKHFLGWSDAFFFRDDNGCFAMKEVLKKTEYAEYRRSVLGV